MFSSLLDALRNGIDHGREWGWGIGIIVFIIVLLLKVGHENKGKGLPDDQRERIQRWEETGNFIGCFLAIIISLVIIGVFVFSD